jgi:hypothetical protein
LFTCDFFSMARQPYMGLGLLVSSSFHDHTHILDTPQSVGLLWTRHQLVAETDIHAPGGIFFFTNSWVFPFDPFLCCINPFSSFHVTYGPQQSFTTQHKHPCPRWDFFCVSGVFPLWSIFVLFKSFRPSCHFTFHATILIEQTQRKHPCPQWDFFFINSWVFPFDPFVLCKSFLSCMSPYVSCYRPYI